MPDMLNYVREKLNDNLSRNSNTTNTQKLNRSVTNRIHQLVFNALQKIAASNPISSVTNVSVDLVKDVIAKLNIIDHKNFSTPLWSLLSNNSGQYKKSALNADVPHSLVSSVQALKLNVDQLRGTVDELIDVLTLRIPDGPFIDFLNFSSRRYIPVEMDIMHGIYIEANGDLSVRPTPGLFLVSPESDELTFLPGLFNPTWSLPNPDDLDCAQSGRLFTPGIMSLPIGNYHFLT